MSLLNFLSENISDFEIYDTIYVTYAQRFKNFTIKNKK